MKLIIVCMCLCMFGCGSAPEIQVEQEPAKKNAPSNVGTITQPHEVSGGCNGSHFTVVMIDGRLVAVPQPMNCNQGPNINKGDPAPDMGDPWEQVMPQIKEYYVQEKSQKEKR